MSNIASLRERAVSILIDHLADNDMAGDASVADTALKLGGRDVMPLLKPFVDSPDRQQRECIRRILAANDD